MIAIDSFIKNFSDSFVEQRSLYPWEITNNLPSILLDLISRLNDTDYIINNGVAIHKTAVIEHGVILKAPIVICDNCYVGANAYLRGGVYLGNSVLVGPSCEVKTSIVFNDTKIAHFNFIGDSIIGNEVNFEAGSIIANRFNERADKMITVHYDSITIMTNTEKFGSLVGDNCKIGANAVLSPGTILTPNSIVKRLELVEQ